VVCRSLAVLAAVVFLLVIPTEMALGQVPVRPPADAPPPAAEKVEAPKVPMTVSADSTGLPLDPKIYVIGPEDIINIKIWREEQLSGAKGVRPDGKITLPLIHDVQAAGLTPERLAAQLKQALEEFVKNPDVVVEVLQVNSKRFQIQGEVSRPGMFPLVTAVHVFDAVGMAGGFREFANKKDIVILRADGTRLKFNYNEFVKGKKQDQNILIQNGDTVLVK
jgi:polysaccharide export outer membrane protein